MSKNMKLQPAGKVTNCLGVKVIKDQVHFDGIGIEVILPDGSGWTTVNQSFDGEDTHVVDAYLDQIERQFAEGLEFIRKMREERAVPAAEDGVDLLSINPNFAPLLAAVRPA